MSAPQTVYERHLGPDFEQMPPAVKALHRLAGRYRLNGTVSVVGPQSRFGKLLQLIFGFPAPADDVPFTFEIDADALRERWTRHFPGRSMTSILSNQGAYVVERLGPVKLWFMLEATTNGLSMNLCKVTLQGLPLPHWLTPRVRAMEHGLSASGSGMFHFDVAAWLPKDTLLVSYRGSLDIANAETR